MDATGNKTGGRAAGTPNKKNQQIQFLADELNCDPAKILMLIALGDLRALGYEDRATVRERNHQREVEKFEKIKAKSKTPTKLIPPEDLVELTDDEKNELNMIPLDEREGAAKELMPYLYGKRKPIDSEGSDKDDPITRLANALRNKD